MHSVLSISEVLEKLQKHVDTGYRDRMKVFIPSEWNMIGVRSAGLKAVSAEFKQRIKTKEDFEQLLEYLDEAFERKTIDLAVVGFLIALSKKTYLDKTFLDRVKKWAPVVKDWAISDIIAYSFLGEMLLKRSIELEDLRFLKDHENLFGKRMYITSFVIPLRRNDPDTGRYLDEIAEFAASREKYIYKAISWALRSGVRSNQGSIRDFLEKYDSVLHGSVIREVRTKLETGRKR